MEKIKATKIWLKRAEGYVNECVERIFVGNNCWENLGVALFEMSRTAPKDGSYDKCDFTVVYEDGNEYSGRYDLKHPSVESPSIPKHMKDFLKFSAGLRKPYHLTQERYDAYIKEIVNEKVKVYKDFLEKYEIGQS